MSDTPTPPEGTPPVDPTETFPLPPPAPSGPPGPAPPGLLLPGAVSPYPYQQPPPPPAGYPSAPPEHPGPATAGVAPPPAPPASRGGGRAVFIVLGLIVLLGIAAAIVGYVAWQRAEDELGDFDDAPGDAYEIEPRRCTLDAAGNPRFTLQLTNTSGDTRNFRVEVGFVVDDETIGPEMSSTSGSLSDGESSEVEIAGIESPGPEFTCRVTNVSFSGR